MLRSATRARMALTSGSKLGRYEIVGLLGAGGMGEVYRARDSRLKREVAIKACRKAFLLTPTGCAVLSKKPWPPLP
jgi:serine/threonine protein kinase